LIKRSEENYAETNRGDMRKSMRRIEEAQPGSDRKIYVLKGVTAREFRLTPSRQGRSAQAVMAAAKRMTGKRGDYFLGTTVSFMLFPTRNLSVVFAGI
jgi:hypothetical protein